jgi:IS30 family transposase
MRLSPDIRGIFRKLLKKGLTVTRIAFLFDTTRQTVYRWLRRGRHAGRESFKDIPREPKASKVTDEVELSILALRHMFEWGTARIQQGLIKLPSFILEATHCVQGVKLSRETINNVLSKHGLNGYPSKHKRWKFFRAKKPDELWQIDFKTKEVTALLEEQKRLPRAILSDHGQQFKEKWKRWCKQHGIEPHFAHPSYPQDKGKVERCIQNLNREFVNHLRKFPEWLKGKLQDYRE